MAIHTRPLIFALIFTLLIEPVCRRKGLPGAAVGPFEEEEDDDEDAAVSAS